MLNWENPVCIDGRSPLRLHGFPWGVKPRSLKQPHDLMLEVAVVHRMIWTRKTGYPNAPEDHRLNAYAKRLKGYDVAVFGDNHKSFCSKLGDTLVWNCGSLFRRTVDQIGFRPSVGLLHSDGTITRHYLDCSEDRFVEADELKDLEAAGLGDLSEFVDELNALGGAVVDFREALHRYLDTKRVPEAVRRVILQALERNK